MCVGGWLGEAGPHPDCASRCPCLVLIHGEEAAGRSLPTHRLVLCLQIKEYEKLDTEEERLSRSRQIYDTYVMKELLACSHVSPGPRLERGRHKGPRESEAGTQGWRSEVLVRASGMFLCPPQPFSKRTVDHVQGHLTQKRVPPNLFQVTSHRQACRGSLGTPEWDLS